MFASACRRRRISEEDFSILTSHPFPVFALAAPPCFAREDKHRPVGDLPPQPASTSKVLSSREGGQKGVGSDSGSDL